MGKQRDEASRAARVNEATPAPEPPIEELLPELLAEAEGYEGAGTEAPGLSAEEDEGIEANPWDGVSSYPPPLERLLLAIICAHPRPEKLPENRLDAAMKALVGRKSSRNRLAKTLEGELSGEDATLNALEWMHVEAQKREWRRSGWKAITKKSATPTGVSVRNLAIEAANRFFPSTNPQTLHSSAEGLRNKFRGHLGSNSKLQAITPARSMGEHDWVKESVEVQSLRRVEAELRHWGINLKSNW